MINIFKKVTQAVLPLPFREAPRGGRCLFALAITILITTSSATYADIDLKRMKRDLTIQESVLDRFFETEEGSTTGLYIKNYGIVLIASDTGHDVHVDLTKRSGRRVRVRLGDGKDWTATLAEVPDHEDQTEAQKKRITEFLSTYSNAIGQLNDNDRVTVLLRLVSHKIAVRVGSPNVDYRVVDTDSTHADSIRVEKHVYRTPGSKHEIDIEHIVNGVADNLHEALKDYKNAIQIRVKKDGHEHTEHSEAPLLEATVTKRDIDAYNRNKIGEQTFQNRITFREHKPQPSRDKKIDIMADILSRVLKQDSELHILGHTESKGLYQKGIGSLFLISHQPDLSWSDDEPETNSLDALKTTIIETLADYGPTLRDLSSNESIIVHLNLIGDGNLQHMLKIVRINRKDKTIHVSDSTKHLDRLIFRVSKRDLDAYARKKIDLDAFRSKVEITEM